MIGDKLQIYQTLTKKKSIYKKKKTSEFEIIEHILLVNIINIYIIKKNLHKFYKKSLKKIIK